MPDPNIKGLATMRWGTKSLKNGDFAAAVILRAAIRQRDGKYFEIEDEDGFTLAVAGLDDGDSVEIEVLDDPAIEFPAFMDFVTLDLPDRGEVKLINKSRSQNLAQKTDGKRSFNLEYYVRIQT